MHKLNEATEQELLAVQRMGFEAVSFLSNNDLYVKHIKPALEHKRECAKKDGEWTPAKTTDATAALAFNAYNSGLRAGLAGIEAVCASIINRGVDAGKELERRRKISVKKEGNNL
jgi:hypothetical protein